MAASVPRPPIDSPPCQAHCFESPARSVRRTFTLSFKIVPLFGLVAFSITSAACTLSTDGGVGERYVSTERTTASDEGSFAGERITVSSTGGSVEVVGVPGRTNIRVRAWLVAGARSAADADAAFRDVTEQLSVTRQGGAWLVSCSEARETHGSAGRSTTGCDRLRVEVPAGSVEAPIDLQVRTSFGGVHASGLVVKALDLEAPFGVKADVTPVTGARLRLWGEDLVSGHCSTELRVPSTTGFKSAELRVQNTEIRYAGVSETDPEYALGAAIDGFPGAPSLPPRAAFYRWTRPAAGPTVDVELRASLGRAVLTSDPIAPFDPMTMCKKIEVDTRR